MCGNLNNRLDLLRCLFKKNYSLLLVILIIIYIVTLGTLSILKYQSFSSQWAPDFAARNQAMWKSLHGGPFMSFTGHGNLPILLFGQHADIIAILLLPLYALYQHPETLLVLQTIALGLGAIPVFLLAKKLFNSERWAVFFSFVYLLYPYLHQVNLSDFRFENFAVPILLASIYAIYMEKFIQFIIWCILATLCNETSAIVVIGMGIYLIFVRRPLKWITMSLIIGTIGLIAEMSIISYYLGKTGGPAYAGNVFYRHFGNNFMEITKNILTHPLRTFLFCFETQKCINLGLLLRPFLYIPLLVPSLWTPILPTFFKNHLLNLGTRNFFEPTLIYYTATMYPFFIFASILFISRLKKHKIAVSLLLLAFSFFSVRENSPTPFGKEYKERKWQFTISQRDKKIWEMIRKIPQNASVATTPKFLATLSNRHLLEHKGTYGTIDQNIIKRVDYLLVDLYETYWDTPSPIKEGFAKNPDYLKLLNPAYINAGFKIIDHYEGVILLKK